MTRTLILSVLTLIMTVGLVACKDEETRPATPHEWMGTWNGPEGTGIKIEPGEGNNVRLTIRSLDSTDRYDGVIDGPIIRFTRDGIQETLRPGTGTDTAMKWLLDYTNCLVVKTGEGFCRGEPSKK